MNFRGWITLIYDKNELNSTSEIQNIEKLGDLKCPMQTGVFQTVITVACGHNLYKYNVILLLLSFLKWSEGADEDQIC